MTILPPTNPENDVSQHKSPYVHVPTFQSLLYVQAPSSWKLSHSSTVEDIDSVKIQLLPEAGGFSNSYHTFDDSHFLLLLRALHANPRQRISMMIRYPTGCFLETSPSCSKERVGESCCVLQCPRCFVYTPATFGTACGPIHCHFMQGGMLYSDAV